MILLFRIRLNAFIVDGYVGLLDNPGADNKSALVYKLVWSQSEILFWVDNPKSGYSVTGKTNAFGISNPLKVTLQVCGHIPQTKKQNDHREDQ